MFRRYLLSACLIAISLSFAGCGKNYLAEKEFYEATQVLKQADLDSGPAAFEAPIQAFEEVVAKYPATPKALQSLRIISNMRLKQQKYDEARDAMTRIVESFSSSRDMVADARFRTGQIYELEGDWSAAEKNYWELAEYNPLHVKGLYAPIRILLYYRQLKDERELEKQFVRALDHYQGLLKQVGPIETSAAVKNYLAMAYVIKGDREQALQSWGEIVEQFPKNAYAPMALLASAETLAKAGEIGKAEEMYNRYYREYPNHALAGKTGVTLGMMYQARKDFEKARAWYQKTLDNYYQKDTQERADIKLLMARTYQDEVLWEQADAIYKELEQEFQGTTAAMQVPLLRAEHFAMIGETGKSQEILDDAISRYSSLEDQGEDELVTNAARRFRSAALAQKGAWNEILADIDAELSNEQDPQKKGRWLFLKALVTENRLQDKKAAAALYQEFLSAYPNHELATRAKTQLQGLNQAA